MKLGTIIAAGALSVAGCDVVGTLPPAGMAQPQFSSLEEAEAYIEASGYFEMAEATDKAVECFHLAEKIAAVDFEKTRDWWRLSSYLEGLAISRAIKVDKLMAPVTDFQLNHPEGRVAAGLDSPMAQRLLEERSDYLPGLSIGRQIYDPSTVDYELEMIEAEEWDQRGAKGAEIYASKGCDILVGLAKAEFGFAE